MEKTRAENRIVGVSGRDKILRKINDDKTDKIKDIPT
jgi:hypothetical protein